MVSLSTYSARKVAAMICIKNQARIRQRPNQIDGVAARTDSAEKGFGEPVYLN
jgi:hypothetical protein